MVATRTTSETARPAAWAALVVAGAAAAGAAGSDPRAFVAVAIGALWTGGALAPGGFRARGWALLAMPPAIGVAFGAVVAARGIGFAAVVIVVAAAAAATSAAVAWGPAWHAAGLAAAGAACCAAGPP